VSLRVFVTGATGFVGTHLLNLLESEGYEIQGTSFPERPEFFPVAKGKKIFHLDLRKEEEVAFCLKMTKPEWVIHLAALSNVRHSWERRKETLETNLMGTFNLFEALRKEAPKARILFVSSSDVYGLLAHDSRALKEEDSCEALSPYAFTKLSGEILSRFYSRVENMDIIIVRSFPHTGPGQSNDFVCSDWAFQIARIERGEIEPIIRVGNCELRRDFSDVRDVVKAYLLLMKKGESGEIYNVCSGKGVLLKEILATLLSFSKKKIEVVVDWQKFRKADIPYLVGDCEKLKKRTSWRPEIPLSQTLYELLEFWRAKEGISQI